VQINSDTTLRHKIERINLLLTNRLSANDLLLKVGLASNLVGVEEATISNSNNNSDAMPFSQLPVGGDVAASKVDYSLIEMLLIDLRKYIASSVHLWNMRMSEFFKKSKFEDVRNL
jgi:hypothetical protein